MPDIEAPGFWDRMDRMVGYNTKLVAIDNRCVLEQSHRVWAGHGWLWHQAALGATGFWATAMPALPPPLCRPTLPGKHHPDSLPSCPRHLSPPCSDAPEFLKKVQKLPYIERIFAECVQLFFMPTKRTGSLDIEGAKGYQY